MTMFQGSIPDPQRDPALPVLVEDIDFQLEVAHNGETVWLNAADGSCIGRFSKKFGIDVHHCATAQMAGSGECIFCTHEPAGPEQWDQFREAIRVHYGILLRPELVQF